ncbi:VOC family protein [Nocardia sp. NPDC020380]|uniref:VOC family protein n=1 Tax=Nocardia sp. NPDC020380 TaxID=3364309 RepID=UPI0037AD8A7E
MPARKAELNHTIVHARDKTVSATFLARILDLPVGESAVAHFLPVVLTNGVTLDFMDVDSVQSQHYAFLISPDAFDAAFARIKDSGVEHWADPGHLRPNEVNHYNGGKGVYFADPDGHNMELLTKA